MADIAIVHMAIEIVDIFPWKTVIFHSFLYVYQGVNGFVWK